MLLALGEPLPKQVYGHPWLLFGEDKMSKSRGNVIYADELVKLIGVDAVRYYLLSEMPFANDGSITYETIIERFNSDLANTLGNLVNRTIAMNNKYFDGVIQSPDTAEEVDEDLKKCCFDTVKKVDECIDAFHMSDAVEAVINLAKRCNKYIDETTPWVLAKDESTKSRLGTVLYNLLEAIRFVAVLIEPFMPDTSKAIFEQMNCSENSYDSLESFGAVKVGGKVGKAVPIFARIDPEKLYAEIDEMQKKNAENEHSIEEVEEEIEEIAPEISIDDFAKVDMRVGEVKACEKVKKSKKLLKFDIDDGMGGRTIVSGIAQYYKPEELVGKKVLFVANLKPVKLCGVESQGMILSAERGEDLQVITVDEKKVNGSKLC
jgi:methionyl-tRNA synthetase